MDICSWFSSKNQLLWHQTNSLSCGIRHWFFLFFSSRHVIGSLRCMKIVFDIPVTLIYWHCSIVRNTFMSFFYHFQLVQIVVWRFLQRSGGSDVLATKQALLFIVLLQYIPRLIRVLPLTSELKRTAGVFAETAWAGAAYYLLLYLLASHVSTYLESTLDFFFLFLFFFASLFTCWKLIWFSLIRPVKFSVLFIFFNSLSISSLIWLDAVCLCCTFLDQRKNIYLFFK